MTAAASALERAPDYAEPVHGWRVWLVVEGEGGLRLRSVVYGIVWTPREALAARCFRYRCSLLPWRRRVHVAPAADCQCGIYASTLDRIGTYLESRLESGRIHRVVGRVSLWGDVVECAQGWRAAAAYPDRIFVPGDADGRRRGLSAEEVGLGLAAYGVPVELLDCSHPRDVLHSLERDLAL